MSNVHHLDIKQNEVRFKTYKLARGLHLYKDTSNSNIYMVKIRSPKLKKYIHLSTKETTLNKATKIAHEYYEDFLKDNLSYKLNSNQTFEYWSKELLKIQDKKVAMNEYARRTNNDEKNRLQSSRTGLCAYFENYDLSRMSKAELNKYFEWRAERASEISYTSQNKFINLVNKIVKLAYESNAIANHITISQHSSKEKIGDARSEFKYSKENNEYSKVLKAVRTAIKNKQIVRGVMIDYELYALVMFLVHGFVRCTTSEVFNIRYKDISEHTGKNRQGKKGKYLQIVVPNGKTGRRTVNSLVETNQQSLVDVYEKLKKFNKGYKDTDYIFKMYQEDGSVYTRSHVRMIFARQFVQVLKDANLYKDDNGRTRSLYSLRHTSLQMRIDKDANLRALAKNAGTSIQMIEKYYAKDMGVDVTQI